MGSDACFCAVFSAKTRIFALKNRDSRVVVCDWEHRDRGTKGPREQGSKGSEGASDAEGDAGACKVGFGAESAVVQEGAVAIAASGGLAAGDAAGGGDSGGANCRSDGIHAADGVSDGAVGAETEHFAGAAGTDGAGSGVRSGVRAGSVGAVAGGSRDGTGGAGSLEETIYE
jgi:hypothetical protein